MTDDHTGLAAGASMLAAFVAGAGTETVTEILGSFPWGCDERGHTWHMGTVWVDSTSDSGFTLDESSDGNHHEIDESEADQLLGTADAEWKRYARYVVETGTDPLSNYMVERVMKFQELWEAQYASDPRYPNTIWLVAAQRSADARWREPQDVPPDVLDYLSVTEDAGLTHRWAVTGFDSLAQFAEAAQPQCIGLSLENGIIGANTLKAVINVDRKIPVPETEVARQLRVLAGKDALR